MSPRVTIAAVIGRKVQAVGVIIMSNSAAKSVSSTSAKPLTTLVSSPSPGSAAASKADSGSKPDPAGGRSSTPVTAETRRTMIAQAAYYIAEQRGFVSGREVEDWLLAEKQIDATLSA
jgi:hypothetical protein